MPAPLQVEYEYFQSIHEKLAEEHAGMYVAIKDSEILGFFADYMEAARALYPEHRQGSVFIQEIKSGKDAHVGIIHTPGLVALK